MIVRREPSAGTAVRGAVLYVHGFSDYFFQTALADYFAESGLAFYAVDLRKSGRARARARRLTTYPISPCTTMNSSAHWRSRPGLIPDFHWADPRAEAEGTVAAMPAGLGTVTMIKGGGHYLHAQRPGEGAALTTGFLRDRVLPAANA